MSCLFNINISLFCQADGALSYSWERENGNISFGAIGVNTDILTLTDIQPEDSGNYRCVAVNTCGSTFSDYANITISGKINIPIYYTFHICIYCFDTVCVYLQYLP